MGALRAAEFFAGIGLMRLGLETAGIQTVWANDIEVDKRDMYAANFGADDFVLSDIRDVRGEGLPTVDLATASFPCTDLSLAGNRRGLGASAIPREDGDGSSMFWEFARVLGEMGSRRPALVLLENVLGFASSHGGRDLLEAVRELNRLGYSCDLLAIDARHFVAQSRPRMFVVGQTAPSQNDRFTEDAIRPLWAHEFARSNQALRLHARRLPPLPVGPADLNDVIERFPASASTWWDRERAGRFVESLSALQSARLAELRSGPDFHGVPHTDERVTAQRSGRYAPMR